MDWQPISVYDRVNLGVRPPCDRTTTGKPGHPALARLAANWTCHVKTDAIDPEQSFTPGRPPNRPEDSVREDSLVAGVFPD
jgi:hypothetical protein